MEKLIPEKEREWVVPGWKALLGVTVLAILIPFAFFGGYYVARSYSFDCPTFIGNNSSSSQTTERNFEITSTFKPVSTFDPATTFETSSTFETTSAVETTAVQQTQTISCVEVCKEISSGQRQNNPVGFATLGAVAAVTFQNTTVDVYCDCSLGDEQAETVFQRRMDGSVDFYRNWASYTNGFGNTSGEYWLGLEFIHGLTKNGNYTLRVDMEDWDGNKRYAEYRSFSVGNSSTNYILYVDGYSGNGGDSLIAVSSIHVHTGMPFSTYDRRNDKADYNCAQRWKDAWWFNACFSACLNGEYYQKGKWPINYGIIWSAWRGFDYSLKAVEMKFRKN